MAEAQTDHVTLTERLVLLRSSGPPVPAFSQRTQRPGSGLQERESPDPDGTQNCGDGGDGGDAALTRHTHTCLFSTGLIVRQEVGQTGRAFFLLCDNFNSQLLNV